MSNLQKITDDAALAEAIKHAMAVAAEKACTPCGQEHDALADWLMELQRTRAALQTAMTVLDQIATTPRNRGAKRSAYATAAFLRTQLATTHNAEITGG